MIHPEPAQPAEPPPHLGGITDEELVEHLAQGALDEARKQPPEEDPT